MAGEARRRRLRALLKKAGLEATTLEPYFQAFVHKSASRERNVASNERLEFLGDSVLGYIAASWLFAQFPNAPEGILTARKAAIVADRSLARSAKRLNFSELLELGAGMERAGGAENETILADAFEAFIGAIYETEGEAATRRFVLEQHAEQVDLSEDALTDVKTRLQHMMQERYRVLPQYRDESVGTVQEPAFHSQIFLKEKLLGSGTGRSKRLAQQEAAAAALAALAKPRRTRPKKYRSNEAEED